MTLFDSRAEEARRASADDEKFLLNFLYFFELRVPKSTVESAAGTSFVFPLILNPTSIVETDPFTLQSTPTADGGLFVEENGVIERSLVITGNTGFRPKPNRSFQVAETIKIENPSFRRRGKSYPGLLSGQRHFQFIQDRVFRIYGDLKRDPATSEDTMMLFHNPKDDEHWEVKPREFRMERDARNPIVYNYNINLLIVDKAEGSPPNLISENKSTFDKIKDGVRTAKKAADDISAAIRDITNFVDDLSRFATGLVDTITSVVGILGAVSDFTDGTARAIARPFTVVADSIDGIQQIIEDLENASFRAEDTVLQSFRRMQDGFGLMGTHPENFRNDVQKQLESERSRQDLATNSSRSALLAAESNPPANLGQLDALGTGNLPGDRQRADAEFGINRNEPIFRSSIERNVEKNDTLPRLAARHLGDYQLWRKIAVLNNLRFPFISPQKLPGTLSPGDRILIPDQGTPPEAQVFTTVFGVEPEKSAEDRLLGTDFLLVDTGEPGRTELDFDINVAKDDFNLVSGIENLKQAAKTRVDTERGHDTLFRNLGRERVVGLGVGFIDDELVRFRVGSALTADPRIASIVGVRLDPRANSDILQAEIDAQISGLNKQFGTSAEIRR